MQPANLYALVAVAVGVGLVAYACASTPNAAPAPVGPGGFDAGAEVGSIPADARSDALRDAGVACVHPPVKTSCAGGWCEVPAGCFWMGSPEAEYGRGQATEPLVPTTLTRSFAIQQYETTQGEWKAMGFPNPTGSHPSPDFVACKEDNCAVGSLTYFEALAYANAKSERDGYSACYELVGCSGSIGNGMTCASFRVKDPISYDCTGYRLPMGAEWEYAARAGTRTAFYSGDIAPQVDNASCYPEPNLDDIAWWCHNAGGTTHPVGLKRPNAWGLYDVLGNSAEYVVDHQRYRGYGALPQRDPGDPVFISENRASRGSSVVAWSVIARAAAWVGNVGWSDRADGITIRLVRTLRKGDAGASD